MIYLVRHGQTAFNRERRYQGHLDSPLTELGLDQARRVGERLGALAASGAGDWAIFASPLGRAAHTAEIARASSGIAAPVRLDARLREVSLGQWDGLTDEEIEAGFPGARAGTTRYDWFFVAPGGERYDGFALRLSQALAEIEADPAANKIVVSHGVAGRVLRGLYAGLELTTAVEQDAPQDAFFRLDGGTIERIDCDPAAHAPTQVPTLAPRLASDATGR